MGGDLLAQALLIWGQDPGPQVQLYAPDPNLVHLTPVEVGWDGGRSKNPASGMTLGGQDLVGQGKAWSLPWTR